jgi:hypothetical protein
MGTAAARYLQAARRQGSRHLDSARMAGAVVVAQSARSGSGDRSSATSILLHAPSTQRRGGAAAPLLLASARSASRQRAQALSADTTTAWQDSMAAFALRGLPQDGPGVRQAAQLLQWGRRANTWASYDSKLLKWFHFCTVIWPAAGHALLKPFPAEPAHILAYLGYLCEQDRVHAASLQPYLSTINSFHADLGHPKPAIGSLVHLARCGFGKLEGEMDPDRARRGPLPACVALQIVLFGLQPAVSAHHVRVCACISLQFAFFACSDTGIQARLIGTWLQEALGWVAATPPPGVLWSSHSPRSGGATAALAIGVDVFTIHLGCSHLCSAVHRSAS